MIRTVLVLLLAPALLAQPLRISDEVPVAALSTGAPLGDQHSPLIASDGDEFIAIWSSGTLFEATRIDAQGLVLDRPAWEVSVSARPQAIVSNGETYLIASDNQLIEITGTGKIVNQRAIPVIARALGWDGSHYLAAWNGVVEVLSHDLRTIRGIALHEGEDIALASTGGDVLAVVGSDTRKVVEYAIISSSREVGPWQTVQAGAAVTEVRAVARGSSYVMAYSSAVEEVIEIDAGGTAGQRVRLEGGEPVSIAWDGSRLFASTAEWLYEIDAAMNVVRRDSLDMSGPALASNGSRALLVGAKRELYDLDIHGLSLGSVNREEMLVSYGYRRQFARHALWAGSVLTVMWQEGSRPVMSRLRGALPLDGAGQGPDFYFYSDPLDEGGAAFAWNGTDYAVIHYDAGPHCCFPRVTLVDGVLQQRATEESPMYAFSGKAGASDGRDFLFVDRFGSMLVDPDGKPVLQTNHVTEYWDGPRRMYWMGSEYLILNYGGVLERLARDGSVISSSEPIVATDIATLDIATNGRDVVGVWRDGEQILAARFTVDGVMVGAAVPVAAASEATIPFIAWDMASFVVAAIDEDVPAGNLTVRRVIVDGDSLRLGTATTTPLPPFVYPTTMTGGPGITALVYARGRFRNDWERLRSYVRLLSTPRGRAVGVR